jgi:hypothetical protein
MVSALSTPLLRVCVALAGNALAACHLPHTSNWLKSSQEPALRSMALWGRIHSRTAETVLFGDCEGNGVGGARPVCLFSDTTEKLARICTHRHSG